MRKPDFAYVKTKAQISCTATVQLISAFVFHYIDCTIPLLSISIKASSHLLCLYSPVCVGLGRKPRRQVFLQRGSYLLNVLRNLYGPVAH